MVGLLGQNVSVTQIEPVHCKLMGAHRKLIMHIIICNASWGGGDGGGNAYENDMHARYMDP